MLGMVLLMAVTIVGADEAPCALLTEEAAVEHMMAVAAAELYEAEVYADAETDFASVLDEVGLAGSTLGREEVRALSNDTRSTAFARNR